MNKLTKFIYIILIVFLSINVVYADTIECTALLGESLLNTIRQLINIVRIATIIIVIFNVMFALIPALVSKDIDSLKKSVSKILIMIIVLILIYIFPNIVNLIAGIFGYNFSCLF